MRRTWLSIILLICYCYSGFAQRSKLDSLHFLLEVAESDLEQIDVLLALARTHMLGEPPLSKGMDYAEAGLEIARRIDNKAQEVNAMLFVTMLKRNLAINNQGEFTKIRKLALASGDPDAIAFSAYLWVEGELYASQEGIEILENIITKYQGQLSRKNLGNTLKSLGWQYELVGEFEKAERTNLEAIEIFRSISKDPEIDPSWGRPSALIIDGGTGNLIQTLVYNGQLYAKMGRYDEAIASVTEAYDIGKNISISDEAWTSMKLGGIYVETGQYATAIARYVKALEIYESQNEPAWISQTLTELGSTYLLVGDYDEAEKRYLSAYEMIKDLPTDRADMLRLLADLYERQEKYDQSINAYMEADSLYVALDIPVLRTDCQFGIASAEQRQGYYEQATQRIQAQIPMLQKIKDKDRLYNAYTRLANIYRDNNQLSESINYTESALALAAVDSLDFARLKYSHHILSELYELQKQPTKALNNLKKYKEYDDKQFLESANESLKSEQVRQNIIAYQEEKEEAEAIATLLSKQNKIYIAVAGLLLALLGIGTYLFYKLRQTRGQLEKQNLQLQDLNHTKDRFFGIIAHDIRSPILALESVDEQMDYYAAKGDTPKLQKLSKMVGSTARQLNSLLDNLLNWALVQTGNIPYKPEVLNIHNIAEEGIEMLTNNAFMKGIHIENTIPININAKADERAVQTIIRNLLSNAIKYSNKGDRVSVSANQSKDTLSISVSDTGLGMSDKKVESLFTLDKKSQKGTAGEKGTGLGLVLVRDLVKLNKGDLIIESEVGQGTRISFTLPMAI